MRLWEEVFSCSHATSNIEPRTKKKKNVVIHPILSDNKILFIIIIFFDNYTKFLFSCAILGAPTKVEKENIWYDVKK